MILPVQPVIGRSAAQNRCSGARRLACGRVAGSDGSVTMARAARVGMVHPIRYPSPIGRLDLPLGSPPVFSIIRGFFVYRQGFADVAALRPLGVAEPFVVVKGCSGTAGTTGTTGQMREKPCGSKPQSLQYWRRADCRPVAIHSPSRAYWAQAQARPQPWCWTATLPPVRWSVRPPMSPIASNTRRAVDASFPRGLTTRFSHFKIETGTAAANGCGGLFHVMTIAKTRRATAGQRT